MIESLQSETVNVGRRADSLETSEQLAGYSRVTIKSGDASYTAGDDSGRALSLECPWGTQEMANDILSKVMGVIYQPYKTTGAIADPAAELGDAVDVGDTHGGIYMAVTKFGRLITSDLSAPAGNETDHEYVYTPKKERQVTRKLSQQSASIGALSAKTDNLLEDYASLIAKVDGVEAGMDAYVLNKVFEDYKYAVARLFATIEEANASLTLTVEHNQETMDRRVSTVETAQTELVARVDGAEASLEQKADSKTVESLNGRVSSVETAQNSLTARVGDAEAALEEKAEKTTVSDLSGRVSTVETAQNSLTARVGSAESSLEQKAEKKTVEALDGRVETVETAQAGLSARVDGAEASIDLNAKNINGVASSVADIEADVIKLKGDTEILGNLTIVDGNLKSTRGIVSDNAITGASIYANGTGTQGIISGRRVSCSEIAVGGKEYTEKEITSTSGTVRVLGIA